MATTTKPTAPVQQPETGWAIARRIRRNRRRTCLRVWSDAGDRKDRRGGDISNVVLSEN
ncbi:hypothetical protein [Streptomyces sp. Da 82-17]|uniref:hypothetical protein n=1 Tax=Streptomyces sp. Da 82-17 TaxID=3377116 RepID=UPI0038D39FED